MLPLRMLVCTQGRESDPRPCIIIRWPPLAGINRSQVASLLAARLNQRHFRPEYFNATHARNSVKLAPRIHGQYRQGVYGRLKICPNQVVDALYPL